MRYQKGNFAVVPNLQSFHWKMDTLGIFVFLCKFADDEGRCFPRINVLSSQTGMSPRTVQRHIGELLEMGILVKVPQYRDDWSQSSNAYEIHVGLTPPGDKFDTPPGDKFVTPMNTPNSNTPNSNNIEISMSDSEKKFDIEESAGQKLINRVAKVEADFEAFWKIYPKKVWKWQARKAFLSALKKETCEKILEKVHEFGEWIIATGQEQKFTKHPATWLNGECWHDILDVPKQKPPKSKNTPTVHIESDIYWGLVKVWVSPNEQKLVLPSEAHKYSKERPQE